MSRWRRLRRRGLLGTVFSPVRYLWFRALRSGSGTASLAGGFAVGVFWGCTPVFILHWPPALWMAGRMGFNKLAATAGVFLSNPLTIPVHYSAAWWIGHWLVPRSEDASPGFDGADSVLKAMLKMGWEDLALMQLGGLVMGLVLCVPSYLIAYHLADGVIRVRQARAGQPTNSERN